MKKYELSEFDIPNQNLTREEILAMLFCNQISVFDMVKGIGDGLSLPLHSHPDFAAWDQSKETFSMDLSANAVALLDEIRRRKSSELAALKQDQSQNETVNPKPVALTPEKPKAVSKVPVLINSAFGGHVSGILLNLSERQAEILLASQDLKQGQKVQFSIVKRGGSDRYNGTVQTCKEQLAGDTKSLGKVNYIYTVQLSVM